MLHKLITLTMAPLLALAASAQQAPLVRSAKSGNWSDGGTWETGKVPPAGARVLVRTGHAVLYDVNSDQAIRAVHVSGSLRFAHDKDTRLDVGLIRVQAGDEADEEGFDCNAHFEPSDKMARPLFEVGSPSQPIAADKKTLIRLVLFPGMKKDSLPALVCCGGQVDLHGVPLSRTWLKLAANAKAGTQIVTMEQPVTGWRKGDMVILTATTRQQKTKKTFRDSTRDSTQTEERRIASIDGKTITLDKALEFDHLGQGDYRGEIANLSRNVVLESADPAERGHTMFHRSSAGSISYAEFRKLGKDGVLGRYSLHYHLVGDTMRGSSVIGASIWDSHNRWLTIHGTNYLVVRDCIGYQSKGHGFFLEDATEVFNILDRNLAVQAYITKPLPQQVLPFDKNDGSGFWWANCHNSFTRNVAAECDEYGYFFQATKSDKFDPSLRVQRHDGTKERVDIRTLPFIRFEDNVSHCQRRHGFNLGGGVPFGPPNVGGVGPDTKHPFILKNYMAYNTHWAIHPVSPSLLIDGIDIVNAEYGIWRPEYRNHVYRNVRTVAVTPKQDYAFVNGPPPAANLDPIDDTPPVTVITHILRGPDGKLIVRGSCADNGTIKKVHVNDQSARSVAGNFLEWEATVDAIGTGPMYVTAFAEDAAGNVESQKHVRAVGTK